MKTARPSLRKIRCAFTLIEIMVVVAIMGMIMAVGVPTLYKMFHKAGFRKTLSDLQDVCTVARRQAILTGRPAEVIVHPQERKWEVAGADVGASGGLAKSAQIEGGASVELLFVNQRNYLEAEEGRIRFFPNGTSDEMTLILRSDKGEQVGLMLDITTGLVSVLNEDKLWELRNGRR